METSADHQLKTKMFKLTLYISSNQTEKLIKQATNSSTIMELSSEVDTWWHCCWGGFSSATSAGGGGSREFPPPLPFTLPPLPWVGKTSCSLLSESVSSSDSSMSASDAAVAMVTCQAMRANFWLTFFKGNCCEKFNQLFFKVKIKKKFPKIRLLYFNV